MPADASNGYEPIAADFIAARTARNIGAATVHEWVRTHLKAPATVLDLGCGCGVPVTEILVEAGLEVFAVDASASMIAALQERFPQVQAECNTVEASTFFGQTFDAVVSWGLVFLLPESSQHLLIQKAAVALKRGGHLLFTAPTQSCAWLDAMTGLESISLGHESYIRSITEAGLTLAGELDDEGGNHYYHAIKI